MVPNFSIGAPPIAFKEGTYGPTPSTNIMMGCVDYGYNGALDNQYACDNDGTRGQKGHIADYAGEFCPGGRLDLSGKHWAWTDGTSCLHLGVQYLWGFAIK